MSHSGSSELRSQPPPAAPPAARGSSIARAAIPHPDDRTVISDRPPVVPVAKPFELGDLTAGDQLGHFELIEYVGGGGMGAVFRARDTMLDREVAVKVLSRAQGADDETRRRFQVEAQSAARLDHQNIARVYYVGEDRGLNFIVFEFIRGVNIRELVERHGALGLEQAVSFTLQIAEALAHASQRNVVHRDIKPSNVIVTDDGRAKLVDMGLARLHAKSANDDLTASGVTLGTFDYISPEQARDPRMADVRSDIYSLGCTLYYMLTARPPFPDGTVLQKLLQHQGDEVPDPRQFNPLVPADVAELLQRMLAKDPHGRFQDAGELIGSLLLLADRLHIRPMTTGHFWIAPQSARRNVWERHLPWVAPVVALTLVVAALQWSGTSSTYPLPDRYIPDRQPPANAIPAVAKPDQPQPSTKTPPADKAAATPPVAGIAARAADPLDTTERDLPDEALLSETAAPRTRPPNPRAKSGAPAVGATPASPDQTDLVDDEPRNPRAPAADVAADRAAETLPVERDNRGAEIPAVSRNGASERDVASTPAPRTPGFTIMGSDTSERRQYETLKAACAAAKNNDVIELQYSGVREEEPVEISNLRLTIRAGEGFRPVITFRPSRLGLAGFGRSMVAVAGGRLSILNVGIVLDIPRDATAEGWSLFETRQAEQLRFEGCTLTIRNPGTGQEAYHEDVAFFNVKAAPGIDSMMKMPEAPPIHPVNLDLQNCIARGEAAFIRSVDAQPLALDWENGLLATTDPLLVAVGSSAMPPSGERVELRLNHLTAITPNGLIRMSAASDAPYLLKTDVSCANSFLITRDAPLVEQRAPQRTAMLEQQFQWDGERNFCLGFVVFWRIVDLNAPTVPRLIEAAQWQSHWRSGDNLLVSPPQQLWKRGGFETRPVHTLRREDLVLADRFRGADGPYEASDTGVAGLEWRKLPDLPAEPAPADSRQRDPQRRTGTATPID